MANNAMFCTFAEATTKGERRKPGHKWQTYDLERLEDLVLKGYSVADVAEAVERSNWVVVCKMLARDLVVSDDLTKTYVFTQSVINRRNKMNEPKMPPTAAQDVKLGGSATMKPATPVIQTVTLIDGYDAKYVSDATIFEKIGQLEASMAKANLIINKPKRLQALLDKTQADIDALVAFVDSRE